MQITFGDGILVINDDLQQNIWSGNTLKPNISDQLLEIATEFFVGLHLDAD